MRIPVGGGAVHRRRYERDYGLCRVRGIVDAAGYSRIPRKFVVDVVDRDLLRGGGLAAQWVMTPNAPSIRSDRMAARVRIGGVTTCVENASIVHPASFGAPRWALRES
jgi:hypothetical protein